MVTPLPAKKDTLITSLKTWIVGIQYYSAALAAYRDSILTSNQYTAEIHRADNTITSITINAITNRYE